MPRDLPILLHSFHSLPQLVLLSFSRVLLQSSLGGCVQYPSHLGVVVLPPPHRCGIPLVSWQNNFLFQASQLFQGLSLLLGQVVHGWLDNGEAVQGGVSVLLKLWRDLHWRDSEET